jgi:hypothetical protein
MSLPSPYWKSPRECSPGELAAFAALVREGGEVAPDGLDELIQQASRLVFCQDESGLVGVAAIKNPRDSYRFKISRKAKVQLARDAWPHELGWVFVVPSARRKGLSKSLVACATDGLSGAVFATSRTDNEFMHATLLGAGFVAVGDAYKSDKGEHSLQLFAMDAKARADAAATV